MTCLPYSRGTPNNLHQNKSGSEKIYFFLILSLLVSCIPERYGSQRVFYRIVSPSPPEGPERHTSSGLHHSLRQVKPTQNRRRKSELQTMGCFQRSYSMISQRTQQEFSNDNTKSPMTSPTIWQWHAPGLMPICTGRECKGSGRRRLHRYAASLSQSAPEGLDSLSEVNELVGLLED